MDTLHEESSYSTSQVAEILGVSRITIFRWIKEGILKATKVGRNYVIAREELIKHVRTHILSEADKHTIQAIMDKTVKEYGTTIRMLGNE